MPTESESQDRIRDTVRTGYAAIASGDRSCCCGPSTLESQAGGSSVSKAVGYDPNDLNLLPEGADMGLSCGNPTALATLKEGEVVLDLGSGGGFDCFIAGPRVGSAGRIIGVDMTPEMISKARGNLAAYRKQSGLDNVEFRLGEIEHIPVADSSVDVVISNCVINLSPDKAQVWREVARVLKPGGRVAVSDMALLRPLPDEVLESVQALVGCVAGASLIEQNRRFVTDAGLTDIVLKPKPEYIKVLTSCKDPIYQKIAEVLPPETTIADLVTSLDITARKG